MTPTSSLTGPNPVRPYIIYVIVIVMALLYFFLRENVLVCLATTIIAGLIVASFDLKASFLAYLATVAIIHPVIAIEMADFPLIKFTRVFLTCIIIVFAISTRRQSLKLPVATLPLLAFIGSIFVTAILSPNISSNLNSVFAYLFEVFAVLVIVSSIFTYDDLFVLCDLLLISLLLAIALGFVEIVTHVPIFAQYISPNSKVQYYVYEEAFSRANIGRISSCFEHPFAFGNFGVVISPLFALMYKLAHKRRYLFAIALSLIPVLLSFSRAVLVTWLVCNVMFILLSTRRHSLLEPFKYFMVIGLTFVTLVPFFGLDQYFTNYFSSRSLFADDSLAQGSTLMSRVDNYINTFGYLRERPWFGFGDKTIYALIFSNAVTGIGFLESYFAKFLLAFGIVGLILLLAYLLLLGTRLIKIRSHPGISPHQWLLVNCSLSLLVAYFLHSLHSAWFNEGLLFAVINLPLALMLNTKGKLPDQHSERANAKQRW